jgi:hypothetical protein
MGMSAVVDFAARTADGLTATITSTLRSMRSAANDASFAGSPAEERAKITTLSASL